jgi:hypothetical protein
MRSLLCGQLSVEVDTRSARLALIDKCRQDNAAPEPVGVIRKDDVVLDLGCVSTGTYHSCCYCCDLVLSCLANARRGFQYPMDDSYIPRWVSALVWCVALFVRGRCLGDAAGLRLAASAARMPAFLGISLKGNRCVHVQRPSSGVYPLDPPLPVFFY